MFVRDLHWPDEEMADHLNRRLKLMASDMIESVVHRYSFVLNFKWGVHIALFENFHPDGIL